MIHLLDGLPSEDLELLRRDGTRVPKIRAHAQNDLILLGDVSLALDATDTLERALPSGRKEHYQVLDAVLVRGLGTIGAHYQVKVQKLQTASASDAVTTGRQQGLQIFISHSANDQQAAAALVDLLVDCINHF